MYAIVDIESNGSGFRKEKIIEIALFVYDGHQVIDQFISLVNPEDEITPFVQKLTGITPKMVKTAPKFHEIAKRVVELTEGKTLVGHNVEFDYRMLRQSFKDLGFDFQVPTLDTISLSKKLIPDLESYSLGKLCKSVGLPHSDVHRAGGDARATLKLFKLLIDKDMDNFIIEANQEQAYSQNYQNKIKELTENLPSQRGIIYFQNKVGKIISGSYTDNIRKKAEKVFHSKFKKNIKIQRDTEHISYEFTGNEIVAQLMMQEKGIKNKTSKPYHIFYDKNSEGFYISSENLGLGIRLFSFKTLTKAENFLNTIFDLGKNNYQSILDKISFKDKNELWVSEGRERGEKSFLAIKNGKFLGYGFYKLHSQISSWEKILNIIIPIKNLSNEVKNEMQIAYLREDFKIIEIAV